MIHPVSKKIVIDVSHEVRSFLIGCVPTGVLRVSLAYIEHYKHDAQALYCTSKKGYLLSREQSECLFSEILNSGSKQVVESLIKPPIIRQFLAKCYPPQPVSGFLLNMSYFGLDKPWYFNMLSSLALRPLFFVHDLIPMTHPEYCIDASKNRHVTRMDRILEKSSAAICNSLTTLNALTHYASQSNRHLLPCVVAPLASAVALSTPGKRRLEQPYFVMLGTIEPRKNHAFLLQIWRDLVPQLGEATPRLIIIGQRGWKYEQVANLLEYSPLLKGKVIELSNCSDKELITYLHHAQALLFPSFVEGYGLPLVESLALNVPVIASDISVFREVAGDIPDYVHPLDGKRWAELILAYTDAHSADRQAQLCRMKKNFKPPTWVEHFKKVDHFLDELMVDHSEM